MKRVAKVDCDGQLFLIFEGHGAFWAVDQKFISTIYPHGFALHAAIKCDKILIEFLKVNTWVRKWFDIDYSEYTLKYGGYWHLPLERKIELASLITGFEQVSVGEYVQEHYEYFRNNVNWNPMDCCNLRL